MDLPRVQGKRKQQWVAVQGTRKQAETKLTELLAQADSGGYIKRTKRTAGDFLGQWLDTYASIQVRPTTYRRYEQIIRKHLVPTLGEIPLASLDSERLRAAYQAWETSGLSSTTVLQHHRILSQALSHGVKWGLLARNVAKEVDAPKVAFHAPKFLDPGDIHRLLEAFAGSPYLPVIQLAVFTGMRRSELLGLRWSDVDLLYGTVSVVQVMHRLKGGKSIFLAPKTRRGKRLISLGPAAVLALRAHRERVEADCELLGVGLEQERLVFSYADGGPFLPNRLTQVFAAKVRGMGLTRVRFHDLRHSHASLMLKQGVHPKVVQERLGHATIAITLDVYSHVTPALQEQAAHRFEEGLEIAVVRDRLAIG